MPAWPQSRAHGSVRSRLVMIECGAPLLAPFDTDEFDETVAITQVADERPADFADRTLRRIASAQRSGQYFVAAELFVGSRHDESTCAARRRVGQAIAEHAENSQTLSELVAVVSADADQDVRSRLIQLNDEMTVDSHEKRLPVRLRCLEARP